MRRFIPTLIALAAGIAGLLLNTLRPVLFTNIEWVFGGIFPLLVAVAFGRWAGLLSGAIAFCLTTQYWLHPAGWLAYGLEPFVVGHLVRRHHRSLLAASCLHWACLGTPIAAIYFIWFAYAAFPANYVALAKYPINGLVVALLAQEVTHLRAFRRLLGRWAGQVSLPDLRHLLISRFSTLTALPVLILSFVAYRALNNQITTAAQQDLQRDVTAVRLALESRLAAAEPHSAPLAVAQLTPLLSPGRELIVLDERRHPLLLPPGITAENRDRVINATFTDAFDVFDGHFTHDRWHPAADRMERFRAAFTTVPENGWTLVVEEPLWRSQSEAVRLFLGTMALAAVAVILVHLLSRATAAEITAPLHDLVSHTAALARGEAPPSPAGAPPPAAAELLRIQQDVSAAAAQLSRTNHELAEAIAARDLSHAELQRVLDRLENTVQERTADLKHALSAAEAADRTKGEFLGMMSHELRTPLNVMLGSLELLLSGQRGELADAQTKALHIIQENGRHLLSLIDDVLDFSHDASGKLGLHRIELDPGEVCALALRLIEPHARRKHIDLSATYDHRVANLLADSKRLRQMVLNLLANAIKFTPEGGRVHLHVHEPDDQVLRITVSDTGIGIPADKLEEIFTPFHQLDRSLTREFEGSGLGLTLVRRFAHLHGGLVWVRSTPEQGSDFHLDLPLPRELKLRLQVEPSPLRVSPPPLAGRPDADPQPTLPLSPATPLPAGPPAGDDPPADANRKSRVLVVEDNVTNAELIRSYLTIMGCETDHAANGEIGVERVEAFRPDLVLMDVQMPVMDGIEATRRIQARRERNLPVPPIVMVTALASAADRMRAFEAGASDYLTKPFTMREFTETVTRHLRR